MTNHEQLGFNDLLADAAETNAKHVFEKQTAHLPDTIEEAIVMHHEVMLTGDLETAYAIRHEAHLMARKINGGAFGIFADVYAPGRVLARASRASDGEPPLWGQSATFEIALESVLCRVEFQGIFGKGLITTPGLGFEVSAVDRSQPFISKTDYRSFLGYGMYPDLGMTPKGFAERVIKHHVETQLKGALVQIG